MVLDTCVAIMLVSSSFRRALPMASSRMLVRLCCLSPCNVFHHMVGGRIWGCCFFVFMSFAALSTVIAVFENIITMTVELGSWTRKSPCW